MLVKYINENTIEKFKNIYKEDGMVYTNEEAKKRAIESGEWLEYVVDEVPEYNENQYLSYRYEIENNQIHKKYTVNDIPLEEEEEIEESE